MALTFFDPITAPTPPARRQPRRPAVLVAEGDARDEPLILADGAAQGDGHLLAVLLVEHGLRLEVALAHVGLGRVELDRPVLFEVDDHPVRGGAVQREPGDLLLAEAIAEGAAAIGFLDAAGQWALAADAGAIGIGEAGARERSGREDQRVLRRQRIDRGGAQVEQRLGDEVPPGPDDLLAVHLSLVDRAVAEPEIVVVAHVLAPWRCRKLGRSTPWPHFGRSGLVGQTLVLCRGSVKSSACPRAGRRSHREANAEAEERPHHREP